MQFSTVAQPPLRADVKLFTETALSFSLTLLNASIDLLSFSAILYATYPPLFGALLAYSAAGTGISLYLGRSLVGLNFNQARCGLSALSTLHPLENALASL